MDWQTFGAIAGVLSFFVTLAAEWNKLRRLGLQRLLAPLLVGAAIFLAVSRVPVIVAFLQGVSPVNLQTTATVQRKSLSTQTPVVIVITATPSKREALPLTQTPIITELATTETQMPLTKTPMPPTRTIEPTNISPTIISPAVEPTLTMQPTPTLDPTCDTRFFVRESAAEGTGKTYVRCPVGEVEYSIQTDDLLTEIALECPDLGQQAISFAKNEQLSEGEQLPTFDSASFTSYPGCQVYITIVNTIADQMGYTIRQEVVRTLATATSTAEVVTVTCVTLEEIPFFRDHQEYIKWYDRVFETKVPFELQREPATGTYESGVYLVLGTIWPESGGSLEKLNPYSALGDPANQITGVAKWIVTSEEGVLGGSGGRAFPICQ